MKSESKLKSAHGPYFAIRWDLSALPDSEHTSAEALCRQFATRYAFCETTQGRMKIAKEMARAVQEWGGSCEFGE